VIPLMLPTGPVFLLTCAAFALALVVGRLIFLAATRAERRAAR